MALNEFMAWFQKALWPGFTKATVSGWRLSLEERGELEHAPVQTTERYLTQSRIWFTLRRTPFARESRPRWIVTAS